MGKYTLPPIQGSSKKIKKATYSWTKLTNKARKDMALKAGLWQMSPKRLHELGLKNASRKKVKKVLSSHIRIKPIKSSNESGGVSADENVRTNIQTSEAARMTADESDMAFHQRSHQGVLIWKTGSATLSKYGDTGDTSEPVSGHTPGIKHSQSGGTTGAMTKEHGRRDDFRNEVVRKTLSDSSRTDMDISTIGKLSSVQLFSSPREELNTTSTAVEKSTSPIYSVFKDVGQVSGITGKKNFSELVERVHTARETDKMYSAKMLMSSGYTNLVPEDHQRILTATDGNVDKAMQVLHSESLNAKSTIRFNTALSSQTDRLDQSSLREMNSAPPSSRPRALSLPRRVTRPTVSFGD